MKKILLANIFLVFIALFFASLASAQLSDVPYIQAAITASGANWTAGNTTVGALTPDQQSALVRFSDQPPTGQLTPLPTISTNTPSPSLDWRNNGGDFVTGIRDQGICGSCWAFGSAAGLEARTLIDKHTPGTDLDLSEQVLVSCSGYGSCNGGYLVDSYFVSTGIPLESCYPYTATNGACGSACPNWQSGAYKVSRYTWIIPYGTQQTVNSLKYSLITYGPTVITFAVYNDFFYYTSGIYKHVTGSLAGYHAVLLVGYDDVNNCFIVKNSWGTGWGESGFFRIAYSEVTGDCKFGYEALSYGEPLSYPVSSITAPADGATLLGTCAITGAASFGVQQVDIGITPSGGSTTWRQANGTSSWSYNWTPPSTGSYNIQTRSMDLSGNVEVPKPGINVTVEKGINVDKDAINITYAAGAPAASSAINLSSVGTINYTATSDSPWLTVSPASELTPQTLTLTINPNTQTPGFISANLTISSPLAVNSPIVIPVNVVVTPLGAPELPHYNWNLNIQAEGCAVCHQTPSQFLTADYRDNASFCLSCHNAAGVAHERNLIPSQGHATMDNVTTGGNKYPTYGEITAAECNNQPFSQLGYGNKVICVTCHNPMRKSEDYGRVWEMTITGDYKTYWLEKGGWSHYGGLAPQVYRDTSLWGAGGPVYSRTKENYLVDSSEYSYNEDAGSITFNTAQDTADYIYVSIDYPYLRASCQDNRLCMDCHSQATHMGANCLSCHTAHDTGNIADIREKVRTPDHLDMNVVFIRYTGINSFADGDTTYNGICEVCHTTTKYYRRDGSQPFSNHSGGVNYDRTNCTYCHSHSTGFAK